MSTFVPYIRDDQDVAELTVRGVILGILLSVILGAANTYLGLRVGLTVSASIPAAVVSLGILRLLRNSSILENNAVQTAASAGESLSAGVLFTLPALVLMGYWDDFHYFETSLIALAGGILGVLFTVPLRRALIVEADLKFPEGIATSEVLKAGHEGRNAGLGALVIGALLGSVTKFFQSGLHMFSESAFFARRLGSKSVFGFGMDLAPALIAVGWIIGLGISSLVFLGGVLGWLVALPLYSAFGQDVNTVFAGLDAENLAFAIWSAKIRYIGAGAMLVGGVWSLFKLRKVLGQAVKGAFGKADTAKTTLRTQQDLGMGPTLIGVVVMLLPLYLLYMVILDSAVKAIPIVLLMTVLAFLFSAVGAYMAGLVGSSNNPISGVTILAVLSSAILLKVLGFDGEVGPASAIFVAGVIACAGAIGSDNLQDLKAGYLLGSTPRRQQIMQVVGVVAAALTVTFVLRLLTSVYELGSPELAAPQAGLMAAVAGFIFNGGLPLAMMLSGMGMAVLFIITDEILEAKNAAFRTPVMPIAVGMYLPVGLSTPIFVGGLLAFLVGRYLNKQKLSEDAKETGMRSGVLMASGLIAGEALVGILIAGLAAAGVADKLSLGGSDVAWTGILFMLYILATLGWVAIRNAKSSA